MDIAANTLLTKMLALGKCSYLSQNVWIPGEDDDDGLPFSSY